MVRPAVTATTDLVFGSLPEFIRRADTVDWDLLRYLAVVCDQVDVTQTVTNEISTGAFTDPDGVRAVWLPWLTQAAGVTIGPYWTDTTTRARLGDTATYYAHGTPKAIRQAVIDRYVPAVAHNNNANAQTQTGALLTTETGLPLEFGATVYTDPTTGVVVVRQWRGNMWVVVVGTTPAVTPLTGTLITTFGELEASFPTFADTATEAVTFTGLQFVDRVHLDIAIVARVEEPAGVKLYHVWVTTVATATPVASMSGAPPMELGAGFVTAP